MVDQIGLATATTPAAPGTLDLTSPDITEAFSGAILIFSATTSDGTDEAGAILGIGFVSAEHGSGVLGDVSMCWFAQDGQNTSPNAGFRNSTNRCVSVVNTTGTGTLTIGAVYSASIAGGVRLNFTTTTIQCKVTAILLAGLSRASADTASASTTPSTETVGLTDYTPDALILSGTDQAAGVDFSSNLVGAAPALGFALNIAGLPQVTAVVSSDDGTEPSDADGFLRSADGFGSITTARARRVGTITSFPATGFELACDVGTVGLRYLALKWSNPSRVRTACANLAVAASGAGVQTWTDFGFVPDLIFGMGTLLAAEDAALEDGPNAGAMSFFVSGRFGSRAWTWHTEEGLTLAGAVVANSHTRQEDVAVLQYDHQGNVVWRGTWVGHSGGSGGFGINFSVASQAGWLTAWGVQLLPSLPVTPPARRAPVRARVRRARQPHALGRAEPERALPPGFWRTFDRYRLAALRRLRWRERPPTVRRQTGEVLTLDPDYQRGDNGLAGSLKGSNALAGSSAGDSP